MADRKLSSFRWRWTVVQVIFCSLAMVRKLARFSENMRGDEINILLNMVFIYRLLTIH